MKNRKNKMLHWTCQIFEIFWLKKKMFWNKQLLNIDLFFLYPTLLMIIWYLLNSIFLYCSDCKIKSKNRHYYFRVWKIYLRLFSTIIESYMYKDKYWALNTITWIVFICKFITNLRLKTWLYGVLFFDKQFYTSRLSFGMKAT